MTICFLSDCWYFAQRPLEIIRLRNEFAQAFQILQGFCKAKTSLRIFGSPCKIFVKHELRALDVMNNSRL